MPVLKPDPLPEDYLEDYWSNWWKVLTGRRPDTSLRGRCVGCRTRGVLGRDLVHRGPTYACTLLCDDCCEEDDDDTGSEASAHPTKLGERRVLQRKRP